MSLLIAYTTNWGSGKCSGLFRVTHQGSAGPKTESKLSASWSKALISATNGKYKGVSIELFLKMFPGDDSSLWFHCHVYFYFPSCLPFPLLKTFFLQYQPLPFCKAFIMTVREETNTQAPRDISTLALETSLPSVLFLCRTAHKEVVTEKCFPDCLS